MPGTSSCCSWYARLAASTWDKDALSIGSVQLPWPRFLLALCVLPLVVDARDWRWTRLLRLPASLGPLLVFWICCGLSVLGLVFAPGRADVAQFLKTFVHLSTYMVFVCALVKWISWRRLFILVNAYYLLGIAAALLSLVQFVHGTFGWFPFLAPLRFQSFEYDVGAGLSVGFRASSVFGEASWASRYYVHWMALALAFWWRTGDRRHLAALTLFVLAFYVANSLVGYVIFGTFVLGGVVAQMWRRNMFSLSYRQKVALVAGAYVLLLLWLVDLTPPIPDLTARSIARVGLFRQGGGAAGNRFDGIWAALQVWQLAPVFGVGLGNIAGYIVPFYQTQEYLLRSRYAADSIYLQLLAETGLVGLMGFLYLWRRLVSFTAPAGYVPSASPVASLPHAWLRFLQFDLIAQSVGMLNYGDYLNPHLWTVVAIVIACQTLILREAARVAPPASRPVPAGMGPVPSFAS